jgi:hypothetical protein
LATLARHTIQGDVSCPAMRNHQFTQVAACRPPDVGMALKDRYGIDNERRHTVGNSRVVLDEKIEHTIEIGQRSSAIEDYGHG